MGASKRVWLVAAVAALALGAPHVALAQVANVDREFIDFGQVNVGDSASENVTVTVTEGLVAISTAYILSDSAGVFEITDASPIPPFLDTGETVLFEISFTPPSAGFYDGAFLVLSDNEGGSLRVELSGEGVEPGGDPEPADLIDALQLYSEAAIDDGELSGTGRNSRVQGRRLGLFQTKLDLVEWFIDAGLIRPACVVLRWLEARTDGARRPNDIVEGPATADVHEMIVELSDALECGDGRGCWRH